MLKIIKMTKLFLEILSLLTYKKSLRKNLNLSEEYKENSNFLYY